MILSPFNLSSHFTPSFSFTYDVFIAIYYTNWFLGLSYLIIWWYIYSHWSSIGLPSVYISNFFSPPPPPPSSNFWSRTNWSPTIHNFPFFASSPSGGGVISMSLGRLCVFLFHNDIIMSHTLTWNPYQDGSPVWLCPLHSLILISAPAW